MLNLLLGMMAARGYGRLGSFYTNQSTQSAAAPWGTRFYMHYPFGFNMMGTNPFEYYLLLAFWVVVHLVLLAILIAVLRWIWKKGSQ